MPHCRFTTDPAAGGQKRRPSPGYVVTLPDKDELLADPHTNYYPPGY